jgi:6-phosphogluconolactonase
MSDRAVQVTVSPDAESLAHDVAARTVRTLAAAQVARGRAALVVTGGGIVDAVIGLLGEASATSDLDWSRVDIWWGDERFVPADSSDRNELETLGAGLGELPLDPSRIHPMPASGGVWGDDLDAAAAGYADELFASAQDDPGAEPGLPALDVILLGVGPDGHCASLFPEHPALGELDALVAPVRNSPKPPPLRTTLTFRALDAIDHVWLIVSSTGKADAVARAITNANPVLTPSAGPRGRRETVWLLDAEAASLLPAS